MRHRVAGRKMGRTASHRAALRRAVVTSLFRHESITTTPAKAGMVRAMAERLITRAKKGGQANMRLALAELGDQEIVKKLFNEIAPRYADREGGYTRMLRLSQRRVNDGAEQCIFELVGTERRADRRKAPRKPKVAVEPAPKAEASPAAAAPDTPTAEPPAAPESAPKTASADDEKTDTKDQTA
jgi:large subunit ribosomal protein L17